MEANKMKSIILEEFGKKPIFKEVPIPEPKEGEFLVKVEASTINPSDRLFMDGL